MDDKKPFNLSDQFKTFWPVVLVVVSLAAQWAILGQRVNTVEARLDRQGQAITTLQQSDTERQAQYAALSAKLDAVNDNLLYIRNRIDSNAR